jgi:hypothetical protein
MKELGKIYKKRSLVLFLRSINKMKFKPLFPKLTGAFHMPLSCDPGAPHG